MKLEELNQLIEQLTPDHEEVDLKGWLLIPTDKGGVCLDLGKKTYSTLPEDVTQLRLMATNDNGEEITARINPLDKDEDGNKRSS